MNESIAHSLTCCLGDYTTDQRGDVGSLVRLGAIQAIRKAVDSGSLQSSPEARDLAAAVSILTVEKLDKVRLQAWECLSLLIERTGIAGESRSNGSRFVATEPKMPSIRETLTVPREFSDLAGVSSTEYFHHVFSWSHCLKFLQLPVLKGFVSSAGAGSETVLMESRAALAQFFEGGGVEKQATFFKDLELVLRAEQGPLDLKDDGSLP